MRTSTITHTSHTILATVALPIALLILTALPAPARAAPATTATIVSSLSPNRLRAHAALTFTIHFSGGESDLPVAVRRSVLKFPAGMSISIPTLHSCSARRLRVRGTRGCSALARLGGGHVLLEARAGSQIITEAVALSAFLGPPRNLQPILEVLGQAYTPYDQRTVLTGAVVQADPPYGEGMIMDIPPIPTVPLEPNASIVTLSLTIGASKRQRVSNADAIIVPRACPAGGFPFGAEFTYADGSHSAATTTAPCPS
jgi:hypothetical protein